MKTGNVDTGIANDHSYFGNGCDTDTWGQGGDGGSDVSCSSRLTETSDSETQIIGTYFNYAAVSVGSGVGTVSENANTPDTFCPLGWQMPYGGTGGDYYDKSRSWEYLLNSYNLSGNPPRITMTSYPFSLIAAGEYYWTTALLFRQGIEINYWTSTSRTQSSGYRIQGRMNGATIGRTTDSVSKTNGFSIRCVTRY